MRLQCRLRAMRGEEGISANVLARDACVTAKTVLRIESGDEVPSVLIAIRIAAAIGVEVEDIFSLWREKDETHVD